MPETAHTRLKPVIEYARTEAERRGDRRIGTDHLLLALLVDTTDAPARALGVTLGQGRAALESLDREALASIGIRLDAPLEAHASPGNRRLPLNSSARSAVLAAKRFADRDRRTKRVAPRHLLLALLATRHPDPAADLLAALDVAAPAVRERLAADAA